MTVKARAKLTSQVRYEGPLAKPILLPWLDVCLGEQSEEFVFEKRTLKLQLLFKLYGIEERSSNAWMDLAWVLACNHVPGMQVGQLVVRGKRGRKPSWKSGLGRELLREVDALRSTENMELDEALEELRADKTKGWKKFTLNNLRPRYREAARAEKAESKSCAFFDEVLGRISHDELQRRFKNMKFGQRRN
jgi:hypothetical protein